MAQKIMKTMKIEELAMMIGAEVSSLFDYSVNKDNRFKALYLIPSLIDVDMISMINNNGYEAKLKRYIDIQGKESVKAVVVPKDINGYDFID